MNTLSPICTHPYSHCIRKECRVVLCCPLAVPQRIILITVWHTAKDLSMGFQATFTSQQGCCYFDRYLLCTNGFSAGWDARIQNTLALRARTCAHVRAGTHAGCEMKPLWTATKHPESKVKLLIWPTLHPIHTWSPPRSPRFRGRVLNISWPDSPIHHHRDKYTGCMGDDPAPIFSPWSLSSPFTKDFALLKTIGTNL